MAKETEGGYNNEIIKNITNINKNLEILEKQDISDIIDVIKNKDKQDKSERKTQREERKINKKFQSQLIELQSQETKLATDTFKTNKDIRSIVERSTNVLINTSEQSLKHLKNNSEYQRSQRDILSDISKNSQQSVNVLETTQKLNEQINKRETAQARIDRLARNTANKRFRLESEYYKKIDSGLKNLRRNFDAISNNPSAWFAQAAGVVLGKLTDKIVDGFKSAALAMKDAIVNGMKDLTNSIFNTISEIKNLSESFAKSSGLSYQESSETIKYLSVLQAQMVRSSADSAMLLKNNMEDVAQAVKAQFGANLKNANREDVEKFVNAILAAKNYGGDLSGVVGKTTDVKQAIIMAEEMARQAKFGKIEQTGKAAGLADRMMISFEEGVNQLGKTREEIVKINEGYRRFASIAQNNEYFNEEMASNIKDLTLKLGSQRAIMNTLSSENVQALQRSGVDINQISEDLMSGNYERISKVMSSLSDAQREAFTQAPALIELLDTFGTAGKGYDLVKRKGGLSGLKETDEQAARRERAENIYSYKEKDGTQLSSKSRREVEIDSILKLYMASYKTAKSNGEDTDKLRNEILEEQIALQLISTKLELGADQQKVLAENMKVILGSDEKAKEELAKSNSFIKDALNYISGNEENKKSFEKEVKDLKEGTQSTVGLLSNINDLGLDEFIQRDGLKGILTGVLDATLKGAFSPEQKTKLQELINGLGEGLKPVFNVFKKLLIDPILTSITDVVGGILGKIYAFMIDKWTPGGKSDEEKFMAENSFKSRTVYDKQGNEKNVNILDYNARKVLRGEGSNDFKSAAKELNKDTSFDNAVKLAKKYNLSEDESNYLKSFAVSKSRGTLSSVLTSDDYEFLKSNFKNIDTNDKSNKQTNMLLDASKMLWDNKDESKIYDDNDFLSEEERTLMGDKAIKLNQFLNGLDEKNKGYVRGAFGNAFNKDIYDYILPLALTLLRQKSLIQITKMSPSYAYKQISFVPNDGHENNVGVYYLDTPENSKPVYFANGGIINSLYNRTEKMLAGGVVKGTANGTVVGTTKSGRPAVAGERGKDEIIIPTDPDKKVRAQALLRLAKEKYNLFLENPSNVSEKLSNWMAQLLLHARTLMLQLDPQKDLVAQSSTIQTLNILSQFMAKQTAKKLTESNDTLEEVVGDASPFVGAPVNGVSGTDALRQAIVERAKEKIGTPYAEFPKGLVCNELINLAYGSVLGAANYKEMLNTLGYKHDIMHTVSGFIGEIRKNNPAVTLASSVKYSALSNLAKPGDLIFSANTGKTKNSLNPDNHGHVNLYIDSNNKIDSSSVVRDGKNGVGIHKPDGGNHMLMNLIDLMPLEWYISKGLISGDKSNIIGQNADGSYIYDPSLQQVPDASGVNQNISRYNAAKIEKEKQRISSVNKEIEKIIKLYLKAYPEQAKQSSTKMSISSIPQENAFCTMPMISKTPAAYHG